MLIISHIDILNTSHNVRKNSSKILLRLIHVKKVSKNQKNCLSATSAQHDLMIILFWLEFLRNKMPKLNSVMSENKTDRSLERMRDHVELF